MRLDYNRWCGFWVDRDGWERRVVAADLKRARKAAKRVRDAERTQAGKRLAYGLVLYREGLSEDSCVLRAWLRHPNPREVQP